MTWNAMCRCFPSMDHFSKKVDFDAWRVFQREWDDECGLCWDYALNFVRPSGGAILSQRLGRLYQQRIQGIKALYSKDAVSYAVIRHLEPACTRYFFRIDKAFMRDHVLRQWDRQSFLPIESLKQVCSSRCLHMFFLKFMEQKDYDDLYSFAKAQHFGNYLEITTAFLQCVVGIQPKDLYNQHHEVSRICFEQLSIRERALYSDAMAKEVMKSIMGDFETLDSWNPHVDNIAQFVNCIQRHGPLIVVGSNDLYLFCEVISLYSQSSCRKKDFFWEKSKVRKIYNSFIGHTVVVVRCIQDTEDETKGTVYFVKPEKDFHFQDLCVISYRTFCQKVLDIAGTNCSNSPMGYAIYDKSFRKEQASREEEQTVTEEERVSETDGRRTSTETGRASEGDGRSTSTETGRASEEDRRSTSTETGRSSEEEGRQFNSKEEPFSLKGTLKGIQHVFRGEKDFLKERGSFALDQQIKEEQSAMRREQSPIEEEESAMRREQSPIEEERSAEERAQSSIEEEQSAMRRERSLEERSVQGREQSPIEEELTQEREESPIDEERPLLAREHVPKAEKPGKKKNWPWSTIFNRNKGVTK